MTVFRRTLGLVSMSEHSYTVKFHGDMRKLRSTQMSKSVLAVIIRSVADTILLVSVEGHLETPEGNDHLLRPTPMS